MIRPPAPSLPLPQSHSVNLGGCARAPQKPGAFTVVYTSDFAENMENHRKKSMKIFEHRSSDETARDPFEDDGEYGSDNNYEPSEEESSSDNNGSESFVLPTKRSRAGGVQKRKKTRKCQRRARRGNSIHSPSTLLHAKQVVSKNTKKSSSSRSGSSGTDSQCADSVSEPSEDADDSYNSDSHSDFQDSPCNQSETENNVGTNERHEASDYEIANSSDSEIFPLAKRLKRPSNDTEASSLHNDHRDECSSRSMHRLPQDDPVLGPGRCSPQGTDRDESKSLSMRHLPQNDPDLGPARLSPQDAQVKPNSPSVHHSPRDTLELLSARHSSPGSHTDKPKSRSVHCLPQDLDYSLARDDSKLDSTHQKFQVGQRPEPKFPSKGCSLNDDSMLAAIYHSAHVDEILVPETPSPCRLLKDDSALASTHCSLQVGHVEVPETPSVSHLSKDDSELDATHRSPEVGPICLPEMRSVCQSSREHSEPAFSRPFPQMGQRHEIDTPSVHISPQNDCELTSVRSLPHNDHRVEPELPSSSSFQHSAQADLALPSTSRSPQDSASTIDEEWSTTTSPIPVFNFDASSVGVRFPVDETTTVVDIFNRVFPPEIVDYIMECTNAYGLELCKKNRPKTRNSRSYTFKEVDREELLKFLGLCLLSGHVATPQKRKLFTMSDALYYHPIFVSVLSARRFEQILRCINVASLNAKGQEKVTTFMDFLTRNFRLCYKPEKELSLDESLLLFKGRLTCKQYIKSKRARYGVKFYELTTSSAYLLNMIMYSGKMDDTTEKGKKLEKTVLRLMRPYLLKGHSLYMDNYYNSVALSQKLLDLKTHSTGTLRVNRKGNPKRLLSKKLKKGTHVWAKRNRIYVSKWVDKRPVNMITTEYHPQMVDVSNRRGQLKTKPREVVEYNKFMSGVDRVDQMVSYYSSPRKTIRWYKKVFFHLLDIAVWNSFFIYKKYCKNNHKSYEFINFREELIRNLIQIKPDVDLKHLIRHSKYSNRKGSNEQNPAVASVDSTNHWPEKIPVPLGSKKKSNYLKCKMCKKNNRRRETGLRCKGCDDKPALCALCFEEWHSQLDN